MTRGTPTTRIQTLQKLRVRAERNDAIAGIAAGIASDLRKQVKHRGVIEEQWGRVVPPAIAQGATVVSLARGVLTVRVAHAGAGFALDRWLASGGLAALRAAEPKVKSVRVKA